MSLIEVLAGLLILGILLVGILMAKSRYSRQWQLAQRTLTAVSCADRMLIEWWSAPAQIRYPAEGGFNDNPSLSWRCYEQANPTLSPWAATVVRLDILDAFSNEQRVMVSVDVVVPKEKSGYAP